MREVLVTGGMGKIGRYLVKELAEKYRFRVVDIVSPRGDEDPRVQVESMDLTGKLDQCELFRGIDTVVHLAGLCDPSASFESVLSSNIVATKNVFDAALQNGCRRVIFASSAQTIEGYDEDVQVRSGMAVRPKNMYGVSKCAGEALGAFYASQHRISVICLRIGAYEFLEDFEEMSARDLSAYLHPDDFNQLVGRCIEMEHTGFSIFNAISNNTYKRLALDETIAATGYAPEYNAFDHFKLKR